MKTRADSHPVIIAPHTGYFAKLHYRIAKLGRMPMWTVYRPVTREYPGKWTARMWVVIPEVKPTRFVMTHDTLEELREMLPHGMACILRSETDPPEIEETWF